MKLSPIIKNKRGQQSDLISIMIVFFVLCAAGGIIWYALSLINDEIKADEDLGDHTESIDAAEKSFGILNWGPVALFIAMIISLFISYYKIGSEPHWFVIHLLVLIAVIIAAGIISNYYYDLTLDEDVGSTFTSKMVLPTLIMFNLPKILTIVGFISIVILVTKYVQDRQGSPYVYQSLPGYN